MKKIGLTTLTFENYEQILELKLVNHRFLKTLALSE